MWTGILLIMTPTTKFTKGNESKGLFSRFFSLMKPHKRLLLDIFLASVLITILGIGGSFYFKILLDEIVPNNLIKTLHIFSIGVVILTLFQVLTQAFRTQLLIHLGQKLGLVIIN